MSIFDKTIKIDIFKFSCYYLKLQLDLAIKNQSRKIVFYFRTNNKIKVDLLHI